jgi:hypothetical protein
MGDGLSTDLVFQFIELNHDLDLVSDEGIWIRPLEVDGWIHLVVEVGEKTTRKNWADAWPLIRDWRERLKAFQGLWIGAGEGRLYEMLCWRHSRESYREIAEWLNGQIITHLVRASLAPSTFVGLNHAVAIMEAMGVEDAELKATTGLDNLAQGEEPFFSGEPISRQMVIDRIRRWREKQPA